MALCIYHVWNIIMAGGLQQAWNSGAWHWNLYENVKLSELLRLFSEMAITYLPCATAILLNEIILKSWNLNFWNSGGDWFCSIADPSHNGFSSGTSFVTEKSWTLLQFYLYGQNLMIPLSHCNSYQHSSPLLFVYSAEWFLTIWF